MNTILSEVSVSSPVMKYVVEREPNTMCVVGNGDGSIKLAEFGILGFTINLIGLILLVHAVFLMIHNQRVLAPKTFKIQWMLFVSCAIQMFLAFVWLFLPFYFALMVRGVE
jgi:hypothetical protein